MLEVMNQHENYTQMSRHSEFRLQKSDYRRRHTMLVIRLHSNLNRLSVFRVLNETKLLDNKNPRMVIFIVRHFSSLTIT
jgi:hypothetical protein